ncbi:ROK family protein [Vibrio litoralis]|uniref:ROK family protein n=1 Tax=Vibrio litoralis TaxID=335972 RepID=UPI000418731B|nr:ROK family protein [Vibrio litoralis]
MYIGLDIGGTKIEICVLDEKGLVSLKKRTPTPKSYVDFLTTVTDFILSIEQEIGSSCKVGIGLPGAISPVTGLIKNANCTFLNSQNLQFDLSKLLSRPINIANDANCFALSEAVDGAGKDGSVVFGAILGTGCGGGIVFNKAVWSGPNAIAGEWGHNPLPGYSPEMDGVSRPCYCGRKNCIEQFISGTGFELTYKLITGKYLPANEIVALLNERDDNAANAYGKLIDQMARCFSSVVNLLDPDIIVLGGGLSKVESIYRDLPLATSKYVFTDFADLKFVRAQFGDSSGIRGAAWLSLEG